MVNPPGFGADMRDWRERNLYSQRDLALALGLAVRTIWGIEAGEHSATHRTQRKFRDFKEALARFRCRDL